MPSRPGIAMTLVYLTLAWIAGILLAHTLWSLDLFGCTTPGWPFGVLAGCAVLIAIFLRRRLAVRLAAILLAFGILGPGVTRLTPMPPVLPQLIWLSTTVTRSRRSGPPWKAWLPATRTSAMCRRSTASRRHRDRCEHHPPCDRRSVVQTGRFPGYAYGDRLHVRVNSKHRRCWTISTIAATWPNGASTVSCAAARSNAWRRSKAVRSGRCCTG